MEIHYDALGAVNPLAPTATAVRFAGLVPGCPESYPSNAIAPPGVTQGRPVPAVLGVGGQASPPRDRSRELTRDAAPVVLGVAGRSSPAVTIAVR